ncbi:MAG TPA: hypothetical protein VGP64_02780 [Polyangia bacterium]
MTDDGQKPADILGQARRAFSPSAADQARVRRAIDGSLAGSMADSAPPPARRASGWGARLLAAGAIAAVSGGIGYWAGHRAALREISPVVVVAPSVPSVAPSRPVAPTAPLVAAPPVAAPATPPHHHAGHSARHEVESLAPVAGESFTVEVRALRNAERALRDGNPGLALAFLSDLDRQVPHGELTEERDAVATLARCARGDHPLGVDLGGEFIERYPASVYRARVQQACAATDPPASGDSP